MTTINAVSSVKPEAVSNEHEQHSIPQTILYHLLPGAFIFLVYIGLLQVLGQYNLPSILIFIGVVPLALIPAELGLLYYLGWKRNGRLSLDGIVLYREPIKIRHYFWLAPLMFVIIVILFIVVSSFSEPIYRLFDWWPTGWIISFGLATHSKSLLLMTYVLSVIVTGIIAPIIEELYFRGFLLPRLSRFGKWAPLIESPLFALYHFWSPSQFVERAIALLPFAYFGQYKRNIYVGMIVHVALNSLLSIPVLIAILAL